MCCVCQDTVKNPKLCPACSNMFCFSCIKQCFDSNKRCPYCRHYVRDVNQFINCHWVAQLAEDIGSASMLTTCSIHPEEQKSLYCNDCKIVICSNCVLFGNDHETHEIRSFKEVCQFKREEAQVIQNALEERLKDFLEIQKSLQSNFHKFSKARDKCYQQMHKTFSESLMLLYDFGRKDFSSKNETLQQKIDTLHATLFDLKDKIKEPIAASSLETIEETFVNLRKMLQTSDLSVTIEHEDDANSSTHFDKKVLDNSMKFGPTLSKTNVCLHNFSYLSNNNKIIHSTPLNFCNLSFRLEVHTNGLADDKSAFNQTLSLYIILTEPKSFPNMSVYDFLVEVVAVNQYGNIERNKKSSFVAKFGQNLSTTVPVPDCKLKLDSLIQCGFIKEEIDCLVLRFSMRPISYQTLSKIQEDYIADLKKELDKKRTGVSSSPRSVKKHQQLQEESEAGLLSKAKQVVSKLAFTNPLVP